MAFDPSAWLKENQGQAAAPPTPAAAAGGFDPAAWLQSNAPKQPGPYRDGFVAPTADVPRLPPVDQLPENRKPQISGDTAVALGGLHGMSGGWLDEVSAALGAYGVNVSGVSGGGTVFSMGEANLRNRAAGDPTGTRTQQEIKQGIREDVNAAREQHPWKFGLAEFGGSMVAPGPKGKVGAVVQGGAYGAGASEATTLGGVADDAAGGALATMVAGKALSTVGKGASAVGRKVFGQAAARTEARATNALIEGTPARTVQDPALAAIGGKENIPKILKGEGIKLGPAAKVNEQLERKLDDVGGQAGKIYDKVVEKDPGVPPEYLRDKLMGLAQKFRHDPDSADAVRSYANRLAAEYTDQGAMNARDLHDVVKALGKRGYGTNPQNPSMGSQLKREIRGEVLGVLQQHVDDVAKQHPEVGSLAELKGLNDRYRKLINVQHIAEARAERDARVSPTLGQRMKEAVGNVTNIGAAGGLVASLASGEPTLAVAAGGAIAAAKLLPHVAAATDRLAANINDARLVNFLRTSPSVEEFVTRAVRIGIPREAAIAEIRASMGQAGSTAQQLPAAEPPLLSGN